MSRLPLAESQSVTLDGTGAGTVRLAPDEPGVAWYPQTVHVQVSSNVKEATCVIYAGPSATQPYFVDGTFSGSSGDATDKIAARVIARTQTPYVWAVWSGGDAGAQATMIITGEKEMR
jgi:hypothetical protein